MTDTMLPPALPPDVEATMALELPDASEVRSMWGDCCQETRVNQREYALNRAFDRGDQYLSWVSDTSEAIVRDFRDQRDRESRTTVNLFRPRRRSLTSALTASEIEFNVRAGSSDDTGMRKQRLCGEVLESLRTKQQWERLGAENVKYTLFGGNAAVAWEWDPKCRNAPPTHDPTSGTLLPAGGVRLSALAITEFGLEPGSPTQEDATWWIRSTAASPRQVCLTYGLDKDPPANSTARTSPMARLLGGPGHGGPGRAKMTAVLVYYRRPTDTQPGCVAHYVEDRCVASGPWPFPHDDILNLYVFSCDDPDESWITDPWLSDARSPQTMYNDVRSTIRGHALRAANARMLVEEGSMDDITDFTDQPGEVLEYKTGSTPPKWQEAPNDNRFLSNEVDRLVGEMNDVLARPDITRGVAPGSRNPAAALSLLAEKADGPLGPFARDRARGWGVIATQVLRTMRHNMPEGETRQSTIYNKTNTPMPSIWMRDDIDPDVEVVVPVSSTTPRSFSALRAEVIALAQAFPQLFDGMDSRVMTKLLGLGSMQEVMQELDGTQLPVWENERLMSGTVCMPDEWNNHNMHIAIHEQLRNTPTFEMSPQDKQDMLSDHIAGHKALAAEAMAKANEAQMLQAQEQAAMGIPPEAVAPEGAEGEQPQ